MAQSGRRTESDFVVVGSGIAGLWFAWRVSRLGRVTIVTKKRDSESNTNYAQGGIAAALAEDDSPELHGRDTVDAGRGLTRAEVVQLVTSEGPRLVRELADLGVEFSSYLDSQGHKHFDLGQEGGHHRRRIVHAKDLTGSEIERGLLRAVRSRPGVAVLEQCIGTELLLDSRGHCCALVALEQHSGRPVLVPTRRCLLATGGIGQVYEHTTNPPIATGDGIAMALRAGATVANMEFIQFHPTALHGSSIDGRTFLVSEALRGEGAVLRTKDGRTFMERYDPDASLAPRDVVARAIAAELQARGDDHVLLDATHLPPDRLRERFPGILRTCLEYDIDITLQPIPVVPAAHYVCGGVAVDGWSRTTVPGLYAAGECACTGLHGANRLASNSLLEALVFADRAAEAALSDPVEPAGVPSGPSVSERTPVGIDMPKLRRRVRHLMWRDAGIVRSDSGLRRARQELALIDNELATPASCADPELSELASLVTVARLIVTCALLRPESRGLHFNTDHPLSDSSYARDTVVALEDLG